ncbi:hypothetical protein MMPV_001431 [Pyropia vietnamensis]
MSTRVLPADAGVAPSPPPPPPPPPAAPLPGPPTARLAVAAAPPGVLHETSRRDAAAVFVGGEAASPVAAPVGEPDSPDGDGEDSKPSDGGDADGAGGGGGGAHAGGAGSGGGGGSGGGAAGGGGSGGGGGGSSGGGGAGGGGAGGAPGSGGGGGGGSGDANELDVSAHKFGWHMCLHRLVQPSAGHGGSGRVVRDDSADVSAGQRSPADFDLTIALSRPLTWDYARNEWRWPKSWRFPDVVVRASRAPSDVDIDAYLTVVTEGAEPGTLLDVGITASDGSSASVQNARLSRSGECRFSRLRLATTGSAHGGQRFQLFLRLFRADNPAAVLTTVLCTPFSAYSRKNSDRKRRWNHASSSREEPGAVSFAPFEPDVFDRPFVRKVTNAQRGTVEEVVDNSVTGLLRYFRAPNIRNKSRHPVFLAVRFDRVLDVYCNAEAYPTDDDAAVRSFIAACGTQFGDTPSTTTETVCALSPSGSGPNGGATKTPAPWMLTLIPGVGAEGREGEEDIAGGEANAARLFELLSNVKAPLVSCAATPDHLPPGYRRWGDTPRLRSVYCTMYAAGAALSATKKRRRAGNYSFRVESSLQAIKAEEVPATDSPVRVPCVVPADKTGVGVGAASSGAASSAAPPARAVPVAPARLPSPAALSEAGVANPAPVGVATGGAAAAASPSPPRPPRVGDGALSASAARPPPVGELSTTVGASGRGTRGMSALPPLSDTARQTPPVAAPAEPTHAQLPPAHAAGAAAPSHPPLSREAALDAADIKAAPVGAIEPLPRPAHEPPLAAAHRRPSGAALDEWQPDGAGGGGGGGDGGAEERPTASSREAISRAASVAAIASGVGGGIGGGGGGSGGVAEALVEHVRELHKQQRESLQRLQSDAFVAVADGDGAVNMRSSFGTVREALLLHATVSGLLFAVLGQRVAGVAESYEFDLAAQLHMVQSLDATLTTEDITSVFMAVNKLVALVTAHLDKVAVHLLPKFSGCFSDEELAPLLDRIRSSGGVAEGFADRLRSLSGSLRRP